MLKCEFCDKECKNKNSHSNHQRCCPKNPNRNYKNGMIGKTAWNKGKTKDKNESVAKQSNSLKKSYKDGKATLKGIATLSKDERSKFAIEQGFGGYRKNAGNSNKYYVPDSFGKIVCLQSSYELKCSQILDEMNIRWIRPKHLKYEIDGKIKRYFPDFYLIDYDIYLDPKNDFLIKKDRIKIDLVKAQNNISCYILNENDLKDTGRVAQLVRALA